MYVGEMTNVVDRPYDDEDFKK